MRPGTAATTLAKSNAPSAMRTMDSAGTVGSGTAEIPRANSVQSHRPSAMPIGMPMTTPTATDTEDCQATEAASWRPWVNPRVFKRASSRRRRRTEATRVSPRRRQRPGGQNAGEQRRGRPDGAVVGDLGRAKDRTHATRPDRPAWTYAPGPGRCDRASAAPPTCPPRADGDQEGIRARDGAALLVEIGGEYRVEAMTAPVPIWRLRTARPADGGQRRRSHDAQTDRRGALPCRRRRCHPTCLWSAAKGGGPEDDLVRRLQAGGRTAASGPRRRSGGRRGPARAGRRPSTVREVHARPVAPRPGRGRARRPSAAAGRSSAPEKPEQQDVVPVPPVERGAGRRGR